VPVNVPDGLPAIDILSEENVFLMSEARAEHQDIRPLEIAILNLMPTKVATETQLLRLLSNSPLQVHVTLVNISGHRSKNTAREHLEQFYISSDEILSRRFDGLIITGAPVETIDFVDLDYWNELTAILDWSRANVYSSLFICWGVNAALSYFYGIEKHLLPKKLSGVYELEIYDKKSHLVLGFDDRFLIPQSRYATVLPADIKAAGLDLVAGSDEAGAVIFMHPHHREVYCTGHFEYDTDTLDREYQRDLAAGLDIAVPINYYPSNDPANAPSIRWRTYAHQFFANWLNHFVYQETPYDLAALASDSSLL
jgi:homoserine O-succinyltransferase